MHRMIRAGSDEGTLVAGDNERPDAGSEGRAMVCRAKEVNARASSKPAGNEIHVPVARSRAVFPLVGIFQEDD